MKKLFESTEERKRKSRRSNRYNKYNDIPFYNTKNIPIRPKDYKEPDYTMDGSIKQLFLNLTKMQITFGKENTLKEFFPEGMKEDNHGNFFIKIGDSKTMFCGHLDTYSREYKRVYHIIQDDIIMTDGTTTLGGDDKAGIVIMIKMIEAGIPGLYYFFRGEEGVTSPTGTWGSRQALKSYKDIFSTYEKCIAFDRRGFNSIISQQSYNECCSDEFVASLSNEFKKYGLDYKDDKTGMWCDSGVFMELIPECTNISVGYLNEHTYKETQDIEHLEKLVNACLKIDWNNLPVKRDPKKVSRSYGRYYYDYDYEWDIEEETYKRIIKNRNYSKYTDKYDDYNIIYGDNKKLSNEEIFKQLLKILKSLNYMCLNPESFEESESIYFQSIKDDDLFALKIVDGDIYMTEDKELRNFTNYGDFDTFKKYIISDDNKNTSNIITEEERLQTYEKIINMYPYLIWDIISDFENKWNNIISSDNWLKLDRIMNDDLKLKMEYASEDGYNPDDFSDWVKDNSDIITTVLKKKIKKFNPKKESFLDKINISDYYTDRQDEVFSDIVEKEKKLVQLIILDFSIMKKAKARQTTLNNINDTLIKLGYKNEIKEGQKNINVDEFVLWVYDNMEDIKDFYKI